MTTRTKRVTVTFRFPFALDGMSRILPAGDNEVVTDEEMIEGLSFPVYRRLATMMMVPTPAASIEILNIDPLNLADARKRDKQTARAETGAAQAKVP